MPHYVKVSKFATLNAQGELEKLVCKLCGTVIGQRSYRTIGMRRSPSGQVIERVVESFMRNHLYTEIKIEFSDGSAHVTNGCKRCLTGTLPVEALAEIAFADEEDLGLRSLNREPLGIVESKIGGGIL